MAIDYSQFAIPKGVSRTLDRIERKRAAEAMERACRKAVHARDRHQCRACRRRAHHLHHMQPRSLGGKWQTFNVISLCVRCHSEVHEGKLHISGDANGKLTVSR